MNGSLAGLGLFLDQFGDCLGGLGAFFDPCFDLVALQFDAAGFRPGIVSPYLLDVAAVARIAPVADDDAVKRLLFSPVAAHSNGYAHASLSFCFSGRGKVPTSLARAGN